MQKLDDDYCRKDLNLTTKKDIRRWARGSYSIFLWVEYPLSYILLLLLIVSLKPIIRKETFISGLFIFSAIGVVIMLIITVSTEIMLHNRIKDTDSVQYSTGWLQHNPEGEIFIERKDDEKFFLLGNNWKQAAEVLVNGDVNRKIECAFMGIRNANGKTVLQYKKASLNKPYQSQEAFKKYLEENK